MGCMPTPNLSGLLRIEDFDVEDSPYRECELWRGVAQVREPSGGGAGVVATRIATLLTRTAGVEEKGWVTSGETGFLLARDPDLMLAADAAFTSKARLPQVPAQGFWPLAPDFCAEVRSPADTWRSVLAKCGVWIGAGVRVVWAVNPRSREVVVFRPGEPERVARGSERIDAAPVLPEFVVEVAALYRGIYP